MWKVIKANEPFSRIVNFLNDSFGLLLMSWSERVQAIMMQLAGVAVHQTHSWALFGFVLLSLR